MAQQKGNAPKIIAVVTLFQGVVDEVRLFQPESEELAQYRADWLSHFGYPSWEAYQQDLANAMPDGEFHEFCLPIPDGHEFAIINHGHPLGWTALQENDRGIYDTLEEAMADAVYAAQMYRNNQLRVHLVGPVVFDPAGWTLCEECWAAYPSGAPHVCEEVGNATKWDTGCA